MVDAYAPLRRPAGVSLLSTDVFDTVLLRDGTTETQRLAISAKRAARALGVDPAGLRQLRWYAQEAAYRAVALTDPAGEASLGRMCAVLASSLGLDAAAVDVLRETEVDVDIEHLRPNTRLVEVLEGAKADGIRVIAVSDTIYSADDLRRIFAAMLPDGLYDEIYTSADLDRTKHDGGIFSEISSRENIAPNTVLHIGDHAKADLRNAERAGWRAVHVPRAAPYHLQRTIGGALARPYRWARNR